MNKKFLIGFGVVAVVIVVAVVTFKTSSSTPTITAKLSVPYISGSVSYGKDTALYSNNSGLVSYNYKTGDGEVISPATGTGGLVLDSLSVTDNHQYMLFHINLIVPGTDLDNFLLADGRNTGQDYWWIYDVNAKAYRPLPTGTVTARLHGNDLYALANTDNGEVINRYSFDTFAVISSVSTIPAASFVVVGDGYVLQDTDNNVYFTRDGIVNRQIGAKASIVAATAGGNQVILLAGESEQIQQINLQDLTSTVLIKGVGSQPLWQASGLILYSKSADSEDYYLYNVNTKITTNWHFANGVNPGGDAVVLLDSDTAVINSATDASFLVGNNLHKPSNTLSNPNGFAN